MASYKGCNPLFAKCKTNEFTDSKNVSATPKQIGKLIDITIKPNYKEATLYADDDIAEQIKEFDSADITLGVDEMDLDAFTEMFGHTSQNVKDLADGKIITEKGDTPANFGTHGHIYAISKNNVTTFVACMLHRVKFEQPEEKVTTKGETITFNTPSITGKAYKDEDGCWRTRVFNIKTLEKAKEILNKLITRAESTLIATSSTNGDTTINAENQGG